MCIIASDLFRKKKKNAYLRLKRLKQILNLGIKDLKYF